MRIIHCDCTVLVWQFVVLALKADDTTARPFLTAPSFLCREVSALKMNVIGQI